MSLREIVINALEACLPVLEAQADEATCDYGAFIQEGGGVPPVGIQVSMEETHQRLSLVQDALRRLGAVE